MGGFGLLWLALGGMGTYLFRQLRGAPAGDEEQSLDEPGADPEPGPESTPKDEPGVEPDEAWLRPLGDTGAMVSLFGLGGGGIVARADRRDEALTLVQRALDLGVNFIDTAPTYGASESHIGEAVSGRRQGVFIATKTLDRSYDETMRLFERSLDNLQTSYIDLHQIHGIRDEEDARAVLERGGALQALKELRDEGAVRFIGVTGHRDPSALRLMVEREDFDCVLVPLNPAEVHLRSFKDDLLDYAIEQDLGIIAMKVAAYGRLLDDSGGFCMPELLGYVCSLPISTAILGVSSLEELEENVRICRGFAPYTRAEMTQLEERAEANHEYLNFYKTEW